MLPCPASTTSSAVIRPSSSSAAIASIGLAIGRLLREVRDGPFWIPAWSSALGLVVVMVWLNDNALFGGQVETIVMATLVGILGAIARRAPTT